MVRSGEAKLVSYHRFGVPEYTPDDTARDLERFIPVEWSGSDRDDEIRLQTDRSGLIRMWVSESPVDVYPNSAGEIVDHWQVDIDRVRLEQ
jgi:hypothetical protein